MNGDLRTLLQETAPAPRKPVDVEEVFARVERRRTGRRAAGAAAVVAVLAAVLGVSQLVASQQPVPIVGEVEDAATLEAEGAFASGSGGTLSLNPGTDVRLRGRVVAEFAFESDAVAVASDGAVGVLRGTTLSILLDGNPVAAREVSSLPVGGPLDSRAIAFDAEGTLWALTGDALVGLRRDGEAIDIPHDVGAGPTRGSPDRLRVTGTDVSIVTYDQSFPSAETSDAAVLPIVGQDPLGGEHAVDAIPHSEYPTMTEEFGEEPVTPIYQSGPGVEFGPEFLSSTSIVGSTLVLWDGQPLSDGEAPLRDGEGRVRLAQSQIVADTVATLAWVSAHDGSFLVVHRRGGSAVAALVDRGPHDAVSVSPDGAVHLIAVENGTTTITTVLTDDLRPVQPRPDGGTTADVVPAQPPDRDADTSAQAAACRGGDEQLRVDGIDLDGDGLDDQARLHDAADRLAVCLGDGSTRDLAAWNRSDDPWMGLEAVDLGGQPGVALVRASSNTAEGGRDVVFVRWVDGAFGAVGADRPGTILGGWFYEEVAPSEFQTQVLYGCRPSTFTHPTTGVEADFEVAQLSLDDTGEQDPTVEVFVEIEAVHGLSDFFMVVDSPYTIDGHELDLSQFPDLTPESDPKQLLRELGFTPRCLPED